MRNFKNNILKIKRNKRKVRSLRRRKIKNLREINSKIITLELNINFFLLKLNIRIVNKRNIIKIRLIIQIMLRAMRHTIESLIKKTKFDVNHCNIKYIIYQIIISFFIIKRRNYHVK